MGTDGLDYVCYGSKVARKTLVNTAGHRLAHQPGSHLTALGRNHDSTTVVPASLSATLRRLPVRLEWDASGPQLSPAASGVLGALTPHRHRCARLR